MRPKYNLSEEAVQDLTERLLKAANEGVNAVHMNADITTDLIHKMTHVTSLTEVIDRDEQLSKTYAGFLNLYGFNSMYDMYMYAKSCEDLPSSLLKSKDYSKLVPVKRKVIRNGKETEVTVYEDPNKQGSQPNEGNTQAKGTPNATAHSHARELKGRLHGKGKKLDTQKIAKLKQSTANFPNKGNFNTTADYFLELTSEDGRVFGVVGYSIEGNYLKMDFFVSNGEINGVAARGLAELIQVAISEKKGVKVDDNPQASTVLHQYGLEKKGSEWSADFKTLNSTFGEGWHKGV
ncbi:virion structural protein [Bacillus phage Moonbeam]|uniref:Uncharacterized protein n=1 Tax=Bacillus phage Moonbeam TaxID=1540091 RepID=A0A0A0RSE6_9CAUD|nr:virion structural protein [Bacillus phage Moonbeam]AIW03431.1 hypothetical protein CPT_Moonbeam33 [Bacillus phage Moonbeam]